MKAVLQFRLANGDSSVPIWYSYRGLNEIVCLGLKTMSTGMLSKSVLTIITVYIRRIKNSDSDF